MSKKTKRLSKKDIVSRRNRIGGLAVLKTHGREFFVRIGRKGGQETARLVAAGHKFLSRKR